MQKRFYISSNRGIHKKLKVNNNGPFEKKECSWSSLFFEEEELLLAPVSCYAESRNDECQSDTAS